MASKNKYEPSGIYLVKGSLLNHLTDSAITEIITDKDEITVEKPAAGKVRLTLVNGGAGDITDCVVVSNGTPYEATLKGTLGDEIV